MRSGVTGPIESQYFILVAAHDEKLIAHRVGHDVGQRSRNVDEAAYLFRRRIVDQHPDRGYHIDCRTRLDGERRGHGSRLIGERRGIHRDSHYGRRDAGGWRNRNASHIGTDAEGRVIATRVHDGELFCGYSRTAEVVPEHQVFLLGDHLRLLRKAAHGQDRHAAG